MKKVILNYLDKNTEKILDFIMAILEKVFMIAAIILFAMFVTAISFIVSYAFTYLIYLFFQGTNNFIHFITSLFTT